MRISNASNAKLSCQGCRTAHRRAIETQKPNRHIRCVYTCAEHRKPFEKACEHVRPGQKTLKRPEEIKLTWCKPKIVHRGAIEAQKPWGCIRRTCTRTQHLNQREDDYKNSRHRQHGLVCNLQVARNMSILQHPKRLLCWEHWQVSARR